MISAVDTNVLMDLLLADAEHGEASEALLALALSEGRVVVCAAVYAELGARFTARAELDAFLADVGTTVDRDDPAALFAAGRAWRAYNDTRSQRVACASCGQTLALACPSCQAPYQARQRVLADFLVGAHAQSRAHRLLTRDVAFFRRHFGDLLLLSG